MHIACPLLDLLLTFIKELMRFESRARQDD
jgi:hypothetical protein